jgi:hypothetical protein
MPQLILGIHPGIHDASAALYNDYDLLAAVQLERLTRVKSDGREFPNACIDEVLSIAGCARRDLDVVAVSRMAVPVEHFTHFRGLRWLREQYRTRVEGWKPSMTLKDSGAGSACAPTRRSPSSTTTRRTHCRRYSTPTGTTRCWSPPMPAATISTTATRISPAGD